MDVIKIKNILNITDTWYLNNIVGQYIPNKVDFATYYYAKSGNKVVSTLLENGLDNNSLSQSVKNAISSIIYNKFNLKWQKLYDTYNYNYDMGKPLTITVNEIENNTLTSNETVNQGRDVTNVDSFNNTKNIKDKGTNKTIESENDSSNYIQGFNGVTFVPSDKTIDRSYDSSENSYDSLVTENNSNTSNKNISDNRSSTYSRENPISRDIEKNGNIGNIPTQELINKEREVWTYQLWDTICSDLDTVLTRKMYTLEV